MDESQLRKFLKTLSERPIPNLSSDYKKSVWRRILLSEAAVRKKWLDVSVSALLNGFNLRSSTPRRVRTMEGAR